LLNPYLYLIYIWCRICKHAIVEKRSFSIFQNMFKNEEILLVGARMSGAIRHRPALSLFLFTEKSRSAASNWPIIQFDSHTITQLIAACYHRAMRLLYSTRGICSSIESPGGKRWPINSAPSTFKGKGSICDKNHEVYVSIIKVYRDMIMRRDFQFK